MSYVRLRNTICSSYLHRCDHQVANGVPQMLLIRHFSSRVSVYDHENISETLQKELFFKRKYEEIVQQSLFSKLKQLISRGLTSVQRTPHLVEYSGFTVAYELPDVPHSLSPEILEEYICKITKYLYMGKESSVREVIDALIESEALRRLLTRASVLDIVKYMARNGQASKLHWFLQQMELTGFEADSEFYNIRLEYLDCSKGMGNLEYMIDEMIKRRVSPDSQIFYNIFHQLNDNKHKTQFIRLLKENLKYADVDSEFHVLLKGNSTPVQLTNFVSRHNIQFTPNILILLCQLYLKDNRFLEAWVVAKYYHEQGVDVKPVLLQMFIKSLAKANQLYFLLPTIQLFKKEFKSELYRPVVNLLLEELLYKKVDDNWCSLVKVLYNMSKTRNYIWKTCDYKNRFQDYAFLHYNIPFDIESPLSHLEQELVKNRCYSNEWISGPFFRLEDNSERFIKYAGLFDLSDRKIHHSIVQDIQFFYLKNRSLSVIWDKVLKLLSSKNVNMDIQITSFFIDTFIERRQLYFIISFCDLIEKKFQIFIKHDSYLKLLQELKHYTMNDHLISLIKILYNEVQYNTIYWTEKRKKELCMYVHWDGYQSFSLSGKLNAKDKSLEKILYRDLIWSNGIPNFDLKTNSDKFVDAASLFALVSKEDKVIQRRVASLLQKNMPNKAFHSIFKGKLSKESQDPTNTQLKKPFAVHMTPELGRLFIDYFDRTNQNYNIYAFSRLLVSRCGVGGKENTLGLKKLAFIDCPSIILKNLLYKTKILDFNWITITKVMYQTTKDYLPLWQDGEFLNDFNSKASSAGLVKYDISSSLTVEEKKKMQQILKNLQWGDRIPEFSLEENFFLFKNSASLLFISK
ncbi:hypothetical protein B5S30_g1729 [[Candida] boidinii]|nr:hypothetical protein B5S30_g1729 [[Candida] boidinii]